MSDVYKTISKGLFYIMAAVLVIFTGWLTVDVGFILLPNSLILPFIMLALYDFGTLSWILIFLKDAAGKVQRAFAFSGFILDLLGVIAMAAAGMYFSGQTLVAVPENMGKYVLWAVIAQVAVNVTFIYLYHLADPKEQQEIRMQSIQDQVEEEAWRQVEAQVIEEGAKLAGVIKGRLYIQALSRMALPIPEAPPSGQVVDVKVRDAPEKPAQFASETVTPPPDVADSGTDANPTRAGKRR